jgi:16S rRNA processing protein RimM
VKPPPSARALTLLPGSGLSDDEIELGYVQAVFGVRGEVKLFLHNSDSDLLVRGRSVLFVAPDGRRFAGKLASRPGAGKRILGKIDGYEDPEHAAELIGWRFGIPKSDLPRLGEGEFYVSQIEGADVVIAGEVVGKVVTVQSTQGPDVLVIRTGADTMFVPCTADQVIRVDTALRVVELVPGALEEL